MSDDEGGGDGTGEDPFEWIEDSPDRSGTPFENLDPDRAGADAGGPPEDTWPADDPDDPRPDDGDTASAAGQGVDPGPSGGPGSGDPFGGDGPDPRGDPFESGEVFEPRGAGEIDPDAVWDRLSEMEAAGSVDTDGTTYAEVSKHSYCEGCEYFSDPPDVACTHEEAEIIEFLDMETVRLMNCPVVAERRALREE